MERKEFLKAACTLGICSCAGMSFLSGGNLLAAGDEKDWRIGFMQRRMAKLVGILDKTSDAEEKKKIFEELGRECAKENTDEVAKFKGNVEGYLEENKKWADVVEYDKEAGTIRIVGKKMETCFCPFVDKSVMPKDFCNCSVGYMKQNYETIFDKKIDVNIEESILRGGERCTFAVSIK